MDTNFKKYIVDLILYCKRETFHNQFKIDIEWVEKDDVEECDTAARIYARPEYFLATIAIYPYLWEAYQKKKYEEIGCIMLHEICHLYYTPILDMFEPFISDHFREMLRPTMERQVQTTRDTIAMLLPINWYEPKTVANLLKGK